MLHRRSPFLDMVTGLNIFRIKIKKPSKIFITHGEAEQAKALAQKIGGIVPKEGDSVEL